MNFFERKATLRLYHKQFTSLIKQYKSILENYNSIPNKELDPYYHQTLFHYTHAKETVKEIENLLSRIIY